MDKIQDLLREKTGQKILRTDLGLKQPFYFRPHTLDETIFRGILVDRKEYELPTIDAKTIFDVGANIGAAAVLFANVYPKARIYCFEPEPRNFQMLVANTHAYPNVFRYEHALGPTNGEMNLYASDSPGNHGGFSLHAAGTDQTKSISVLVQRLSDFIRAGDLKEIDFMKLDCEGGEFDIIDDVRAYLPRFGFIFGEAHGVNDFKMFDALADTFDVGIIKPIESRVYKFYAKSKAIKKFTLV